MADDMAPRPALIMVAPNGARRTKADHPALPTSVEETVRTAVECRAAGAGAIHLHIRDRDGLHTLDPGIYREAAAGVKEATEGQMFIQVTTEAVGRYRPDEQVATVRAVKPDAVSVALREICPARRDEPFAADFYHWAHEAGIGVQHILYSADEVYLLSGMIARQAVPGTRHAMIFVLGRYTAGQQSDPADLDAYLRAATDCDMAGTIDWMVCAFGSAETACLADALARGGHARVGFENSLWNADGSRAASNSERVVAVGSICPLLGRGRGDAADAASILGVPGRD
jgi:3-keto-5-aminohexanoate cleavage enzyme